MYKCSCIKCSHSFFDFFPFFDRYSDCTLIPYYHICLIDKSSKVKVNKICEITLLVEAPHGPYCCSR